MRTFHDIIKERGENNFKVVVVTANSFNTFENLKQAKVKFPTLDPFNNTHDFTSASVGDADGETMRFEDWEIYNSLSN